MEDQSLTTFPFQIDEFYLDLQSDGRTLKFLSEDKIKKRPFPGLRPFKTSESQLFKGRDGQSEELLNRLSINNFVAVLGSSGAGKSSLTRAGLIPLLFGGFLPGADGNWEIAICRPGREPIKNLAVALAYVKNSQKAALLDNTTSIEAILKETSYGILEVKRRLLDSESEEINSKLLKRGQQERNDESLNILPHQIASVFLNLQSEKRTSNLLIIIDQFEELFRFNVDQSGEGSSRGNTGNEFVQLLLTAASGKDPSIYVAITMRSEFLGDCVKFKGLPEIINKAQYLVPQLERKQLRDVIEQPILRAGKKISPQLVEFLINEIESEKLKENLDHLPILQHALMRSFDEAFNKGRPGCDEMLLEHYEHVGGMKDALKRHANEVFASLSGEEVSGGKSTLSNKDLTPEQNVAKLVFQALTEASSNRKGGRRPTSLQNIYNILDKSKFSKSIIDKVINKFREENTSFITPPENTLLSPELTLDISHESLTRNWTELKGWLLEEFENSEIYRKLNEARERNENEPGIWIRGVLYKELLDWRDSPLNNAAWAARYQKVNEGNESAGERKLLYEKNLIYLNLCEESINKEIKAENDRQLERIERESKTKRNKNLAIVAIIGFIISISFGVFAFLQFIHARQLANKAQVEKLNAINENKKANQYAEELRKKELLLISASKIAEKNSEEISNLLRSNVKLNQQKLYESEMRQKILELKKNELTDKNSLLISQNDEILRLYAESRIKDEPFYKLLDNSDKYIVKKLLIPLRIKKDSTDYKTLASIIEKTVKAQTIARSNPNLGLAKIYDVIQESKNEYTEQVADRVLHNNVFYQQKIKLATSTGTYVPRSFYNEVDSSLVLIGDRSASLFKIKKMRLSGQRNIKFTKTLGGDLQTNGSTHFDIYVHQKKKVAYFLDVWGVYSNELINPDSKRILVKKIPFTFSNAAFIPEAKAIILVSKNMDSLRCMSLDKSIIDYSIPLSISTNKRMDSKFITCLKIDPYTSNILIGYSDGVVEIRGSNNGQLMKTFNLSGERSFGDNAGGINSIDVSNNNIIAALNSSTGTVGFFDFKKGVAIKNPDSRAVNGYNQISISPDAKYFILGGSAGQLLVNRVYSSEKNIYNLHSDLGFQSQASIGDERSRGYENVRFLNDSAFIIHDPVSVQLWKIDPHFNDINNVWKSLDRPYLSIKDQVENNIITLDGIGQIKDTSTLISEISGLQNKLVDSRVGSYDPWSNTDLEVYKRVTDQIGKITKFTYPQYAANKGVIALLENTRDQKNGIKDYSRFENRISETLVLLSENPNKPKNLDDSLTTSLIFAESAWSKFFIKDFSGALNNAQRAYDLDSSNLSIKNVALSFLLTGKNVEVEGLYRKYKDRVVGDLDIFDNNILYNYYNELNYRSLYKDLFLRDLEILEEAGLIDVSDPRIIRLRLLLNS